MEKKETLWIFTDGACSGNPGPGGWGVVLKHSIYNEEISGYEAHTTNNRMELTAVIQGLQVAIDKQLECDVVVVSDSQYVVKGITQWILQWQKNGWRTSQKANVENRDLWETLLLLGQQISNITWQWVKAHNGHIENEAADLLARKAIADHV